MEMEKIYENVEVHKLRGLCEKYDIIIIYNNEPLVL